MSNDNNESDRWGILPDAPLESPDVEHGEIDGIDPAVENTPVEGVADVERSDVAAENVVDAVSEDVVDAVSEDVEDNIAGFGFGGTVTAAPTAEVHPEPPTLSFGVNSETPAASRLDLPPLNPPAGDAAAALAAMSTPAVAVKRGKGGIIAGAVLGIGLLGGGGAFAYTQLIQEKGNTPETAVESFYMALANADAIGLAEALEPGERDVFIDSVVPMVAEMNRLKVFEGADLKKVQGVTGSLTGFKATHKLVRDDLAEVTISDGSLTTNFDPKKLPFGKSVKDALGDVLDEAEASSTTTKLANDGSPFVVHKTGKRWYVSINYSVAESARKSANEFDEQAFALPLKAAGVPAKGAESPEAAVSEMLTAMADLNVERMVQLVPPDELPALQNYAGMWIEDAKKATAEANKNFDFNVRPKLKSESIGKDRALVTIDDLPMDLKVQNDDLDLRFNYADKKGDAKVKIAEGDIDFEGKYANGDFNGRLLVPDAGKATLKAIKKDISATYDGEDGSQVRIRYDAKKNLTASLNMSDGTAGNATLKGDDLQAQFSGSDGTTGTVTSKGSTAKAFVNFPDGSKSGFVLENECLTITTNDVQEEKKCGRDEVVKTFLGGLPPQSVAGANVVLDRFFPSSKRTKKPGVDCGRNRPRPKVGFVAIKRAGGWYVSPSRTMLDWITASMKTLEPGDFDCYGNQFAALRDNLEQQFNQLTGLSGLSGDSSDEDPFTTFDTLPAGQSDFDFDVDTLPTGQGDFNFDTLPSGDGSFDTNPITSDTSLSDEEFAKLLKELEESSAELNSLATEP